jgi:NitT/TauT family transport system substrate-binding protein
MDRRRFLAATSSTLGVTALGMPALAAAKTKIRIGYLHTLAVDGQIWLADHLGAWGKNDLDPQFKEFKTGIELFTALSDGSIDMLTTGAVISNFPARQRQDVSGQLDRVRHRAALGARGSGHRTIL